MVALALVLAVGSADASGARPVAPDAAEAAGLLGLEHSLEAVRAEGTARAPPSSREEITRRVLQASFEADSAIAQIQEEQAAVAEVLGALQSEHDARLGTLNLAAGVFAAGAAVGTAMTLDDRTATAGTWITTVASGVGAALALYAALAPGTGTPPVRARSNLLAPFFGRPLVAGSYPPLVWAYLDHAPPGETVTRRQQLLAQWIRLGKIGEGPGDPRIDALVRPISDRRAVDIGSLQDRSLMLWDVRARIASMKQGLLALLESMQ